MKKFVFSGNHADPTRPMRSFLFSFVIPAWNVAPWLPEAVESVLAQTVGFRENIQLILVNDGSDDDTGAVCARYRDRFPDNVVFLDRPHRGVSAARNAGMAAATGRWLNFLDADDKWDRKACAAALAFFEAHPDIDIVCFPLVFFGRSAGGRRPDDRAFKGRGTVDIFTDANCRISNAPSCFIRTDVARRHAFDERLTIGEDTVWIEKQALDARRVGMCDQAEYRYRKRPTRDSATDRALDPDLVLDILRFCRLELLRYAEERRGRVPAWAQHTALDALGRSIRREGAGLPTAEARRTYRNLIRECLVRIDDPIILAARGLDLEDRLVALALKHDVGIDAVRSWIEAAPGDGFPRLRRPGAPPVPFAQAGSLRLDILDIKAGRLTLVGALPALAPSPPPRLTLTMTAPDGRRHELPCEVRLRPARRRHPLFDDAPGPTATFELSLPLAPLADNTQLRARLEANGAAVEAFWLHGTHSPLKGPDAYLIRAGCLVGKLPAGRGLTIGRAGPIRAARREWALIRRVALEQGRGRAIRTACVRLAARALRRLSRKPIWLFCDRAAFAGDNGEALFAYLMAHPEARRHVRPIFILARDSEDRPRLKRIGPVVALQSGLHRLLFLAADKIISSHVAAATTNPLGMGDRLYRDLYNFDFVFLQHGVIKDDLSAWLNRTCQNIALFVTSAARERDSILQGDYGYGAEQVILTGLPRHDGLVRRAARDRPRRLVAVMPTWRENLVAARDPRTGLSLPNPAFARSGYFRFWNGLLNHPRLPEALRRHGYRLRFVIHPQSTHESDKFEAQDPVAVLPHCDYRQTLCEAALLVTDYSSVAFDFALLKKPVLYAQFDRDAVYAEHIYAKGYFDYDRDGFGPVRLDLESTVDAVIHFLENGCEMAPQYRARVDAFFGPRPENRCRAVLDAINGLGPRPK